jgi:signal transduction histidine kinase
MSGAAEQTAQRTLRLLLAEDSVDDEQMLLRHLARAGYAVSYRRVENAAAMRAALDEEWDVIISDFNMPRFSAPEALSLVRERNAEIPFIVISGSVGEEAAVRAMKGGANDYVMKGKLARLESAIERELREARVRQERRRMREQLVVADRLASIGMLAAGVAHEINNPLAAIVTNLELLGLDLDHPETERERVFASTVHDTLAATHHLLQIVRDLGVLSRGSDGERFPASAVDVEDVLETAIRMSSNLTQRHACLTKVFTGVPPVLAEHSKLAQVFLNLLVNAAHAIAPGQAASNEIRVRTSAATASEYVTVEVSDTGSGISPEALPRIFEPFYTTKPTGLGTGLGLAISSRIVSNLGGRIEVESAVGRGTTFRVLLPRARH